MVWSSADEDFQGNPFRELAEHRPEISTILLVELVNSIDDPKNPAKNISMYETGGSCGLTWFAAAF